MEIELSRFQKENNILELKVVEEYKKLKAKEQEMIMERTRVRRSICHSSISYLLKHSYRSMRIVVSYRQIVLHEMLWIVLTARHGHSVQVQTHAGHSIAFNMFLHFVTL